MTSHDVLYQYYATLNHYVRPSSFSGKKALLTQPLVPLDTNNVSPTPSTSAPGDPATPPGPTITNPLVKVETVDREGEVYSLILSWDIREKNHLWSLLPQLSQLQVSAYWLCLGILTCATGDGGGAISRASDSIV